MNKEQILEKSRKDNKNKDIYEKEVVREGSSVGAIAAALLATVFFIIQLCLGGGMNLGLYALVFVISAATFTVKAIKLKRMHEILVAVLYWVAVICLSAAHIVKLIEASKAL